MPENLKEKLSNILTSNSTPDEFMVSIVLSIKYSFQGTIFRLQFNANPVGHCDLYMSNKFGGFAILNSSLYSPDQYSNYW